MKLPKRQSGQTVVEFALVIPLFVLILMGIMSFSMYFSDYIALNNIARSVAREASLMTDEDKDGERWADIKKRYENDVPEDADKNTYYLPNSAYTWNPSSMVIKKSGTGEKNVKVVLSASVASGGGPTHALATMMGNDSFLSSINIEYEMYWEKKPTETTKTTT